MAFAVLTGVKKLQVLLSGAVATSECPITVNYRDRNSIGVSEASTDAITTGGTAVDVVAAPPAGIRRELEGFSLYNDDTTSVTVTVRVYVNSSTTRIIFYGTILTDESLFYDENSGWYSVNSTGQRKMSSASDVTASSSQASSIAATNPHTVSSLQSLASVQSFTSTNFSTISSGVSLDRLVSSLQSLASVQSFTATNFSTVSSGVSLDRVVSSLQSNASTASFTATTWSTASSAVSRVKSSFSW